MYYYLIIGLFLIGLLFEIFIDYLGLTGNKNKMPDNVSDIYDSDTYNKWQSYKKDKSRLDLIETCVKGLVVLLLFIFKLFSKFGDLFGEGIFNKSIGVLVLYGVSNVLISVVFDYIRTFKVEEKYGFNKSTIKLFIKDQIINTIFEFGLIIGITCLYIGMYNLLGIYGLFAISGFIILIVLIIFIFNRKFMRLFNKFTRLEDGELRDKLTKLLSDNGYSVREIEVMNASKRTTKANAMFTGIGKFKSIILYDNLFKELSDDAIVAVFSHELGHGKHNDTLNGFIRSIIMIILFVLSIYLLSILDNIYLDNGFSSVNYGFAMIILMEVVINILSPLLQFLMSFISRKQEYNADNFAYSLGYGDLLISSLKKIAKANLSDLNPHPIVVKLTYSHPTLSQRIDNIKGKETK